MDLSKLSSEELRQLQKDIDKELTARRRDEQKQAKQELKQVAERYGFSVEELVGNAGGGRKTRTSAKAGVTFRHPDDPSKTWTGRGRKPNWVKEWEATGRSLEDLRAA